MKNFCIIFLSFVIIILTAVGFSGQASAADPVPADYLRMHIRAHSNGEHDQEVKYRVRDTVVEYLTPLVTSYQTKKQALQGIEERLPQIAAAAQEVLQAEGFAYGAKATLQRENFPTRAYGEYLLPAGEYTALVLHLGDALGDNWWCVVYPPLCFTAKGESVVYKSKIKEIIDNFYKK